jgi:hypothetical protein
MRSTSAQRTSMRAMSRKVGSGALPAPEPAEPEVPVELLS